MNNTQDKYWFKSKKYGIGWIPCSREGWFFTVIMILAVLFFAERVSPDADFEHILFELIVPLIFLTVLMFVVMIKKGEPLKWKWGDKNNK